MILKQDSLWSSNFNEMIEGKLYVIRYKSDTKSCGLFYAENHGKLNKISGNGIIPDFSDLDLNELEFHRVNIREVRYELVV